MILYATVLLFLLASFGLGLLLPPAPGKRRRLERAALMGGIVAAGASFLMVSYSVSVGARPAYLPEYFGPIGIGALVVSVLMIGIPLAPVGIARIMKK